MIKITDGELEKIVGYLEELNESRAVYDIPLIGLIDSLSLALPKNIEEVMME